ncbi:MAG: hypothetical protein BA864_10950 [Desulfuromonadales bacterium C00003093]|nr:MAG: hypothetical protein BA864_10950 [Desulfuromonadales bacterium C00003093]
MSLDSICEKDCNVIATIVNRVDPENEKKLIKQLKRKDLGQTGLVYTIPDKKTLGNPTVGEIAAILDAEILYGKEKLNTCLQLHSCSNAAQEFPGKNRTRHSYYNSR